MNAPRLSDPQVMIVPGLQNSGPAHWQSLWRQRNPAFDSVVQSNWSDPDLNAWSEAIVERVRLSRRDVVLVAHSFGCLASVRAARLLGSRVRATLLVAPADPKLFRVSQQLPRTHLGFPSILVASRNDRWMPLATARQWADRWGSQFIDLGDAGHINVDAGFGEWPFGERLLRSLMRRVSVQPVDHATTPATQLPAASPSRSLPFAFAI